MTFYQYSVVVLVRLYRIIQDLSNGVINITKMFLPSRKWRGKYFFESHLAQFLYPARNFHISVFRQSKYCWGQNVDALIHKH